MAYTKQTWTNDESAVLDTKMGHIEQGIYDNSLATDKIKPSGTATTTAEIEAGQINDVIGFKSLKLKGQTSQETTQGNNLLNIYARHLAGYTETVSGVTFTYNDDGSINANGTATADINYFIASKGQLGNDIFNGTNYLSGCTGGSLTTFYLQFWADTIGTYPQATTEVATSKTAGVNWNITIGIKNGVTIDKTFYPMMSATSGKTFEKYSGGKASPNPDFPQDVNNVSGNNVITIGNVNLSEKWETGDINAYTGIESANTSVLRNTNYIHYDTSLTYRLSVNGAKPNNSVSLRFYNKNKEYIGYAQLNVGGGSNFSITVSTSVSDTTPKYFRIRMATTVATLSDNIMVTTKSDLSYIAHQGNNFSIDLPVENKLPYPYVDTTKTNNGITYTDLRDGRIKVNGTATANSAFALYGTASSQITLNANYVYGGVNSNVRVRVMNRSSSGTYTTLGNSTGTSTKIDRSTITTGYVEISIASGTTVNNLIITPMLSDDEVNAFTPFGVAPIEIYKIGTAQDYIYRKNGRWYVYRAIRRAILDGTNNYAANKSSTTNNTLYVTSNISNIKPVANNGVLGNIMSSHFKAYTTDQLFSGTQAVGISKRDGSGISLAFGLDTELTTKELVNAWLAEVKPVIYYEVLTPTEEEITYTPLIRQLDELYNSGLYDLTNISQDNSSEAFILDLEACKNNINGIVEYIRR